MFFFFILDIFFAFRHIGETFVEPKILPGGTGVVRHPGFRENIGGKGPAFDSRRGAPVQHILLDIDDDEDKDETNNKDNKDEHDKHNDTDNFENNKKYR